jgi:hypothetical protein
LLLLLLVVQGFADVISAGVTSNEEDTGAWTMPNPPPPPPPDVLLIPVLLLMLV